MFKAIACALGLIASPYTALSNEQSWQASGRSDKQAAQAFYKKARIIVSTLPPSLLSIKCLFFCGVYEMYAIRPVTAWLHFSQASLQLKLHLLSTHSSTEEEFESSTGRLLRRLYWSCMQSES